MILPFLHIINGFPSFFPEKILRGLYLESETRELYQNTSIVKAFSHCGYSFDNDLFYDYKPKLHTIRQDSKNRWKPSNTIHFAINNRTPKYFNFAVSKCMSTQFIQITWHSTKFSNVGKQPILSIDGNVFYDGTNFGEYRNEDKMQELAINDGFLTIEEFFKHFSQDFTGKLIHWTELKY